ncbi:hypothetical protein B0H10DRAFT_2198033 [Mycena sp. CBHHK59/15]|nr:hypothetical protein B0H10DRAFT_2198033 [Mycena sp. CBHHK59/15]
MAPRIDDYDSNSNSNNSGSEDQQHPQPPSAPKKPHKSRDDLSGNETFSNRAHKTANRKPSEKQSSNAKLITKRGSHIHGKTIDSYRPIFCSRYGFQRGNSKAVITANKAKAEALLHKASFHYKDPTARTGYAENKIIAYIFKNKKSLGAVFPSYFNPIPPAYFALEFSVEWLTGVHVPAGFTKKEMNQAYRTHLADINDKWIALNPVVTEKLQRKCQDIALAEPEQDTHIDEEDQDALRLELEHRTGDTDSEKEDDAGLLALGSASFPGSTQIPCATRPLPRSHVTATRHYQALAESYHAPSIGGLIDQGTPATDATGRKVSKPFFADDVWQKFRMGSPQDRHQLVPLARATVLTALQARLAYTLQHPSNEFRKSKMPLLAESLAHTAQNARKPVTDWDPPMPQDLNAAAGILEGFGAWVNGELNYGWSEEAGKWEVLHWLE